ncbi:MAG: pyruvate, phosphate dikinase [bacterium]|nr:pyruvate, phosphate dikinase [bacterium]
MDTQYVYRFSPAQTDGNKDLKALLGGKGANLAEMSRIGLPVPPGFTISTEACARYQNSGTEGMAAIEPQVREAVAFVEQQRKQRFGDPQNPLLFSVRSGAAISMPGMMDTVLNLGLNEPTVAALQRSTGNPRFVYDLYRRFIDMFGDVVMGVKHELFEAALVQLKLEEGAAQDTDLSADALQHLSTQYLEIYQAHTGEPFPADPWDQLFRAIEAVFRSWGNERAIKYRRINQITGLLGTAVNVQSMVYGNRGPNSATGVLFTRNPANGENKLFGEYLVNAQGEDVVAGIRTPSPIEDLRQIQPECYGQIEAQTDQLERHFKCIQDIEFTIEEGELFILQTRTGKRTGPAAMRIACAMVDEGLVSPKEAVAHLVEPEHLNQMLHPTFADEAAYQPQVLALGLPASPGAAVGRIVFEADEAELWAERGEAVVLVRQETSPDDVGGMHVAQGIVTARGGMTSHAAVVARGWGKCCVAGCGALKIHADAKRVEVKGRTFTEGDWISLNGTTGEVIEGRHPLKIPEISGDFARFMGWVDQYRRLKVRANAETPTEAQKALEFGAQGIGLCRTEHMFFQEERLLPFREMILAESLEDRKMALEKVLPYQREDFEALFRIMTGQPVTIRLLDPPLHEFLPKVLEDQERLAQDLGIPVERVQAEVEALSENNPMLGFRGCRLGNIYPEITQMQVRAIFEAALQVQSEGLRPEPEVMVPLVGDRSELDAQRGVIQETIEAVFKERGQRIDYRIGSMIEVPRAAILAGEIAEQADFFSFGTNDLTQMTFGFSRDDAGTFLPQYVERKLLLSSPFDVLDQRGVGQLMQMAIERGRATKPQLQIGICGEHGGEPNSVAFCHRVGLDYVSCSPYRVPIAKLAAAQAALKEP